MPTGTVPLSHYFAGTFALTSSKYDRHGRYRKSSLVTLHGADIGLPEERAKIAADCPKMRNAFGNDLCGARSA